ncbi:MAG: hypothetical protein RR426_06650 [Oscillospiraceae bacterium]
MKKCLALLLCVLMTVSLLPVSAVAARDFTTAETQADALYDMGLFRGVGQRADGRPDYALNRAPTRLETLILLIRLLGREQDALQGKWTHPFTDVSAKDDRYVGFAYENGLTRGLSATTFAPKNKAAGYTYLTFVLRALGYVDGEGKDFSGNDPFPLAQTTGILPDGVDTKQFLRADAVLVSYAALSATLNHSSTTLLERLTGDGAVTERAARASGLLAADTDVFALGQGDNFLNSGIAVWDDSGNYFIYGRTRDDFVDEVLIERQDSSGAMTTVYRTSDPDARLCDLSIHNGKLYFSENTAQVVPSPYYHLVELDPVTGEKTILFSCKQAMCYVRCGEQFYILYCTGGTDIDNERYTFARIEANGDATPLLPTLSWEEAVSFDAYGWKDTLYFTYDNAASGDGSLQALNPKDGSTRVVVAEDILCCTFSGDDFYYYPAGAQRDEDPSPLYHVSLHEPSSMQKITDLTSFGDLFLHHGLLYQANSDKRQLVSIDSRGQTREGVSIWRSSAVCLVGGKAIVPEDSVMTTFHSQIKVMDLNTGEQGLYCQLFGLPYDIGKPLQPSGTQLWNNPEALDQTAELGYRVSRVFSCKEGLAFEIQVQTTIPAGVLVGGFSLEGKYDGQPLHHATILREFIKPGKVHVITSVFPEFSNTAVDLSKLSWAITPHWEK